MPVRYLPVIKLISLLLPLVFLSSPLKADGPVVTVLDLPDPDLWLKIKPVSKTSYWMVYREETDSEFYERANGTIIPMAIYRLDPDVGASWALCSMSRKGQNVDVIFRFKNDAGKEDGFTSDFFSKGEDKKLSPSVSFENDCFRISIPEEEGKTRYVVFERASNVEDFRKKFKISPLMPGFTWDKLFARLDRK